MPNIKSTSKILKSDEGVQPYELGSFISEVDQLATPEATANITNPQEPKKSPLDDTNEYIQAVLNEVKNLQSSIMSVEQKVNILEKEGVKNKDLDKQIVEALKDLKNYSSFFEKATFAIETKILSTSMKIAQKIIGIEVGENSSAIAKQTIENLMQKLQSASKVSIHLNPKDYIVLKDQLNFGSFVTLQEDPNVAPAGVVIASDLGNFDGNIDVKVNTMLESLDNIA